MSTWVLRHPAWHAPSLSVLAVHSCPVLHCITAAVVTPHLHGYVELTPPATFEQTGALSQTMHCVPVGMCSFQCRATLSSTSHPAQSRTYIQVRLRGECPQHVFYTSSQATSTSPVDDYLQENNSHMKGLPNLQGNFTLIRRMLKDRYA